VQGNHFTISQDKKSNSLLSLKLQGSLSARDEHILSDQLAFLDDANVKSIELDFSELKHISGAGLKLFLIFLTKTRMKKKGIQAIGLSDDQLALLRLTHLNELIHIINTPPQ
jgi:anti-anti-sigma regulatory factor